MALTLAVAAGQAQTSSSTSAASPPPPPPPSGIEQWIKEVKTPVSWLTWGGDFRARNEYLNNAVSLTDSDPLHEQDVFRFRARVWTTVSPIADVNFYGRLAAEPREWMRPSFAGTFRGQSGMEWRYGIADNLYVKWTNILDQPLSVSAGRQDMQFGDYWNWWLVADGTPGDGSWTYFLDSIRVGYEAADIKTKFDLVYIYQNALPDEWIPTIGESGDHTPPYSLTEQNEQGVIAYVSNKSIKNTTVDGYFIYKRDDRELANGDNANIYTVGGRVTGLVADQHVQYAVEGGYQFGNKQDPTVRAPFTDQVFEDRDLRAYGGNARLSYLFKDRFNNQAHVVYEYLSGDDPDTKGTDEMFDILWGRWPRWSELYIYSYIVETGGRVAQLNNIQRVGAGWSLNPIKNMTFTAYYNALFAPQEVPTRALIPGRFSGDGNFRGHYVQAYLKHQFTPRVAAHLWSEFVWEGDFYAQRDLMTFLRGEVSFTF